jgi:hypothetical protein
MFPTDTGAITAVPKFGATSGKPVTVAPPGSARTAPGYETPEAADALLEGAGGNVAAAVANAGTVRGRAAVINRAAQKANASAQKLGAPPAFGGAAPPKIDFSAPLTSQAATRIEQIHPVIQQMNDLEKQLDEYAKGHPTQLANLLPEYLTYLAGVADENSDMIANMKLISVAGATEYTRNMSRAVQTLHQVQMHLPDIKGLGLKNAQLALSQLRLARTQLQRRLDDVVKFGIKGGVTQQAAQSVTSGGQKVKLLSPQGLAYAYPSVKWEANRKTMEAQGWRLAPTQ